MLQKSNTDIFVGYESSADFLSANSLLLYLENGELTEKKLAELIPAILNNCSETKTSATGFGYLIHRLKTSFMKREGDFYLKIFPWFILEARNHSSVVDEWFKKMQVRENAAADLYQRSINLRKMPVQISETQREKIKKIIILPRNTIGAEAFINGTIISPILETFKNAEVLFIDPCMVGDYLFNYPRVVSKRDFSSNGEKATLTWNRSQVSNLERIINSVKVSQFINCEIKGLKDKEYMIIDADTRMSQTGAMPIALKNHYFIDTVLESDSLPLGQVESISNVCSRYLNNLLGTKELYYPKISLNKADKEKSETIWASLGLEKKKVALVSFTAGLPQKTLSERYEKQALLSLLGKGLIPIIERAPTKEEDAKNISLLTYLRERGIKVSEINASGQANFHGGSQAYTIDCKVGLLCGLIEKSSLILTYDSKNQHVASALNRPLITVFTGHPNKVFLQRWAPVSRTYLKTIEIDKNLGDYEHDASFRDSCDDLAIKELEKELAYCRKNGII